MPCLKVPVPPLPTLPAPLSLSLPELPDLSPPMFCCKLPPVPIPIEPPPIPSTVLTPAIIATLNGYIDVAQAYLDSLPVPCPIE